MQNAKNIFNIKEIGNARFLIVVKGGAFALLLVGLVALGFWQPNTLRAWFGMDRFFKEKDEDFKILVLPFKQICQMGGKNYDAGYVLVERLQAIASKENLKIKTKYWSSYHFEDFGDYTAKELQQYHRADMIVYGAYQTEDCSAEGDQICLNYITDERWNLGEVGINIEKDYKAGGLDDLKKGKLQEEVENIALFLSILAQIKSVDHQKFLEMLKNLLIETGFGPSTKANILIELADRLRVEGKLRDPIRYYKQAFDLFIEDNNEEGQAIAAERLGQAYKISGSLEESFVYFHEANTLFKKLHDDNPENVSRKNGLAISYSHLGNTYLAMGDAKQAMMFFEERLRLTKELVMSFPQNRYFKHGLAISNANIGDAYYSQQNWNQALIYFQQDNQILKELFDAEVVNDEIVDHLALSYSRLGDVYSKLGNIDQALHFFELNNLLEQMLCDSFPHNVRFKNSLAVSYGKMGEAQRELGHVDKSLDSFTKMTSLFSTLHSSYPENVTFKNGLAVSYAKLGLLHKENLNNLPKARIYFSQAESLWIELARDAPMDIRIQIDLEKIKETLAELE